MSSPLFVVLALGFTVNPFAGVASSSGGSVDRWPMFHKDLMHTGNSKSKAPDTNQILWKFNTGGQVGSPFVVDGVVYVGSEDNKVYALNASTGAHVWSYKTGDMVVSSPAVANGIVYVGSYDHLVYAFGTSPSAQIDSTPIPTSIILLIILTTILLVGLLAVVIYRRKR